MVTSDVLNTNQTPVGMGEENYAAQLNKRRLEGLTPATYFYAYSLDQAYLSTLDNDQNTRTEAEKKIAQANAQAIESYWKDFNRRSWFAWVLAIIYGALQGWGMAGFVKMLLAEAELDEETSRVIGGIVALNVMMVNAWLVRPDIEKLVVFGNSLSSDKEPIHKLALAYCVVSALLIGSVVSYGVTNSLGTDDLETGLPTFVGIMFLLAFAEGLLNIQTFDAACKKGGLLPYVSQEHTELLGQYKDEATRNKASRVYWGAFILSFLGMIGIALVGTKCLSNNLEKVSIQGKALPEMESMLIACFIIFLATLSQIPFYSDRAKQIAKQAVGDPEPTKGNLIFTSRAGKHAATGMWFFNALFNAPCAFLGVVTMLARFAGISKSQSSDASTFEKIFCKYGTGSDAAAIYTVGAAFFLCAFVISLAANFPPFKEMANPKKEMDEKNNPAKRGLSRP